jgi:serine/threonine-protein kinase
LSNTGSLVYVPGPVVVAGGGDRTLALLDRRAGIERLKVSSTKAYSYPRLSPDGKRVAVSTDDKDANVWIIELAGDIAPRQLTLGGANRYPVWSADGQRVAFQSDREGDLGIFWQKADGTGTAERLTKPEKGITHIPDSWAPDGKKFSYTAFTSSESSVVIFSIQDKTSTVFVEKAGVFFGRSAFSPDGQWLAYQTTETGTGEVFVQPFPSTGAKYPVVKGGHPFWSPDGREIIYNPAAGAIGIVGVTTRPTFSFGQPTVLPTSGLQSKNPATDPRVWDFAPDGKRLLGVTSGSDGSPAGQPQVQVVLNWFNELQQRALVK